MPSARGDRVSRYPISWGGDPKSRRRQLGLHLAVKAKGSLPLAPSRGVPKLPRSRLCSQGDPPPLDSATHRLRQGARFHAKGLKHFGQGGGVADNGRSKKLSPESLSGS